MTNIFANKINIYLGVISKIRLVKFSEKLLQSSRYFR